MTPLKPKIKAAATRSLTLLPESSLLRLERLAKTAQGKGWGTGTVSEEVRSCLQFFPSGTSDGMTVIDVGANAGSWTAAMLAEAPDSLVYCFEPSSVSFAKLSNRFEKVANVSVFQVALGRESGKAQLWSDRQGSGMSSLTQRRLEHFGVSFNESEEVKVISLDEWCSETGVVPTVIKLDVEGHELDVLAGAEETLKSVRLIQFEFGGCNIDTRTYFQDFFYFFRVRGFQLYRIAPRGVLPVHRYREEDETFQTTNYIAVRMS